VLDFIDANSEDPAKRNRTRPRRKNAPDAGDGPNLKAV